MKKIVIVLLLPFFIACIVVMLNKHTDVEIDQKVRQQPEIEITIDTDTTKIKRDSLWYQE